MGIEIIPIGGYNKVEGNSTAIKVDDEVVILDMGLTMDNFVNYQNTRELIQEERPSRLNYAELLRVDAVPDFYHIKDLHENVKAVIPSHAHLDHVGAVPFGMKFFKKVPVIGTPYTMEFLKRDLLDKKYNKTFDRYDNHLITVNLNSTIKISDKITIEFIHVTHSIPDSAIVTIHTPYGSVMYAVDYKLDEYPQIGNPPNYKRHEKIGKEGVKCLILESLYADYDIETPSEEDVKKDLHKTLSKIDTDSKTIFLSTFSSHIARIKTLIETGLMMNREVYLVGRSLATYTSVASKLNLMNFKNCKIIHRSNEINDLLEEASYNRGNHFIIGTGHQGEPHSVLSRIADNKFSSSFMPDDIMIFSSSVIPTEQNQKSFAALEKKLKHYKLNIIKDIHASGHAGLKDHEKMLKMLNPEFLIPAHAGIDKTQHLKNLSERLNIGKAILVSNGDRINLKDE